MSSGHPQDKQQKESQNNPQDNPGLKTTVPTTEEGNTPVEEEERMTGQESGTDVRSGAEAEAPGGTVTRPGLPNQGTDSR